MGIFQHFFSKNLSSEERRFSNRWRISGMSLVEVLVALAIVSLVFVYINNLTFESLRRVKRLELQDKMLTIASEGVEIIKKEKSANWTAFTSKFPGAQSTAYIRYDIVNNERNAIIEPNTVSICNVGADGTFPASCQFLAVGTQGADTLFGRIIKLEQINNQINSYARLSITVACIQGRCTGADYKPITLTTYVYRTN